MEDSPATRSFPDTQLFRDVFDTSPIGIVVETLEGQPLFVNPAFCSLLGFSEEELRNKHCVDFSPREDAEKDWQLFQQLKQGVIDHYQLDKRYFRRDGSLVWGRLSLSLLNNGSTPLVMAMVENITDKKRAEDALRESEERLRLAVQAARMFAYSWDAASDRIERSGESAEILGIAEDSAATGEAVSAMIHPDDRENVEAAITELNIETPNLQIAYRIIRPDGKIIWVERHSRAYFDSTGNVARMVGMVVDVTERNQAEEKLLEYEKAVEGAEDMIGVIDREYRFLLANRQYLKMRNLTREQVVGRFIPEVLSKEVFEGVIKPKLDECFQGKIVNYEMKFSYPTIGERYLSLSYYPIEGPNGIDRAACILHDVTDRKRAEQALAEMTRRLLAAQEQERTRIGRELHDDINQRLAMLAVELEQLKENPSEIETRLQELQKQTTDISDDVHAVAHDLHSSKLEYLGVVAGIKSWCKEFAQRQKVEINCTTDVRSVPSREIGLTLFRLLQEALHNAIKHSGVKLVEVRIQEQSGEIHLVVADSGKGFNLEEALQGTGLGLASMRERVRLVNGTITIDAKPMSGTTIDVRVPLSSKSDAIPVAG